jgi:hypothetical protein
MISWFYLLPGLDLVQSNLTANVLSDLALKWLQVLDPAYEEPLTALQ